MRNASGISLRPSAATRRRGWRGPPGMVITADGLKEIAPVAQLDRVLASEARGRGFESRRARQTKNPPCAVFLSGDFQCGCEPTTPNQRGSTKSPGFGACAERVCQDDKLRVLGEAGKAETRAILNSAAQRRWPEGRRAGARSNLAGRAKFIHFTLTESSLTRLPARTSCPGVRPEQIATKPVCWKTPAAHRRARQTEIPTLRGDFCQKLRATSTHRVTSPVGRMPP